ncbi:MAG: L-threonylcarbamoyladenylate synthase [Rickettsiales bacterium]|jgi:L-threonylcarbamoyladenylate synthase|nr:L-threonylcarbamoyladenylate synthase [Rickettsiales bacterium]
MAMAPTRGNIRLVAGIIKAGRPAIFPAGTVFGMGGLAGSERLADEIRSLKGRKKEQGFLVNLPSLAAIRKIARVGALEAELMRGFMPGGLTLVLELKPGVRLAAARDGTVGVRIPDSRTLLSILRIVGEPVISTSCNRTGQPPAMSVSDAEKIFPGIPAIGDTSRPSGTPSTIARVEGSDIRILRPGIIPAGALLKWIRKKFPAARII